MIWARKNQTSLALEDINWARETLNDSDRRLRADGISLNLDTMDGLLRRWSARFGLGAGKGETLLGWQPLDVEKPLSEYVPDYELPDRAQIRAAVVVPDVPVEVPAVLSLLEHFVQSPLDPWALELPEAEELAHE